VPHTYALYEGGYGIINEYQVAIGESTCQAKFFGVPASQGGKCRIEAREMSIVALERSKTAREAIQTMGDLATSLGFYAAATGPDVPLQESQGEGGEGLTVVDKHEAWVFHVSGDDTQASAVWAAQRVPPGHVSHIPVLPCLTLPCIALPYLTLGAELSY
jgi:dipeptidase